MSLVALEHDRHARADRLLQEIAARHGLPPTPNIDGNTVTTDRFLAARVSDGATAGRAQHAIEFSFAASLSEALDLLRQVTRGIADAGSAVYVHDLDAGMQ
jgi:hypothetical protein